MSEALALSRPLAHLRDFVALGKPRLSFLVLFTAAVGLWLAPLPLSGWRSVGFVLATSALVAAANTLNCWIEREIDALMNRTCERPLPAGRLEPRTALVGGTLVACAALGTLAATTNLLTTSLGLVALTSYVLIYTPLKRVTPWAVFVGAIPGAMPPLMGWTASTGELGAAGGLLFAILFCWQLPHFVAISIYLAEDFRRGGIRVLPVARSEAVARRHLVAYSFVLALVGLAAQPLGIAGSTYTVVALALGGGCIAVAMPGLRRCAGTAWARRVFAYSLIHLPLLITTLVLDRS